MICEITCGYSLNQIKLVAIPKFIVVSVKFLFRPTNDFNLYQWSSSTVQCNIAHFIILTDDANIL